MKNFIFEKTIEKFLNMNEEQKADIKDSAEYLSCGHKIRISVHEFYQIQPVYKKSIISAIKYFNKLKKEGYRSEARIVNKQDDYLCEIDLDYYAFLLRENACRERAYNR
jgi:hypothetical protein